MTAGPPRRRRSLLLLAGVVAAAGLTVFAVRALPPPELDRTAVERDVASAFEQRGGVALDPDCPEMPVASGEVYHCDGTTSDGERLTVEIQIGDKLDGSYDWVDFPGPVTTATPAPRPGG